MRTAFYGTLSLLGVVYILCCWRCRWEPPFWWNQGSLALIMALYATGTCVIFHERLCPVLDRYYDFASNPPGQGSPPPGQDWNPYCLEKWHDRLYCTPHMIHIIPYMFLVVAILRLETALVTAMIVWLCPVYPPRPRPPP